jgi:hypothetical protein
VVLGGRQDSIDSFKRTLELSERLQVGIHPVLLTPLPGTELYDQYREHLVPGLGWESFTGVKAVFDHPDPVMSPLRREMEYHQLSHELFRFERIVNRIGKISSDGFPSSHIYSFMMQVPMKHALSKAYEEWKIGSAGETAVDSALTSASIEPEVLSKQVLQEDNDPVPFKSNAGFRFWAAAIVAISIVDVIEFYYLDSTLIDILEILLLLNSVLFISGHLYLNRKRIWRNMDVVIDWTRDGLARKRLMIRQMLWLLVYIAGQYWGFSSVFQH